MDAARQGRPVFFTGEMVFPWMFDDFAGLRPYKDTANKLAAHRSWPALYSAQVSCNYCVFCSIYCKRCVFGFTKRRPAKLAAHRSWPALYSAPVRCRGISLASCRCRSAALTHIKWFSIKMRLFSSVQPLSGEGLDCVSYVAIIHCCTSTPLTQGVPLVSHARRFGRRTRCLSRTLADKMRFRFDAFSRSFPAGSVVQQGAGGCAELRGGHVRGPKPGAGGQNVHFRTFSVCFKCSQPVASVEGVYVDLNLAQVRYRILGIGKLIRAA